jgi:phospholipid/cholesterol/gamma-HCH transport system substrate-binding protein
MNKDRKLEVKVGGFVLGLIALGVVAVLLLGKSKHVFESRVKLHATFADVAGLVQGAPVRVSGVNVGTVAQIMFVRADPRPEIRVDLQISHSALGLIREDSVATISAQGLLGDKIIEIQAGTNASPQVADGGEVKTGSAPDFDKMMKQAAATLDDVKHVADRAAQTVDTVLDPKTVGLIRESVEHIHGLLHQTDKGDGLAHALFYDRKTADDMQRIEANLTQLSQHVDEGVQHINTVLGSIDGDGRNVLNNVSRAAKSIGDTADSVQKSKIVANLDHASGDLAQMTAYVKSGRGTMGSLIMDPTVYEQLVQVLGGVGRSRILRALVRYAIARDGEQAVGRVVDDKNVPDVKTPKHTAAAKLPAMQPITQ